MNAAMTEAAAATRHAVIAPVRPGWFVIRNSNAPTWEVPKKTT